MADSVLTRDGPVAAPLSYTVPASGELVPVSVRATMDGSSASVPFYATLQVIAPSGRVMGSYISTAIAAGGSADVTWFPDIIPSGTAATPPLTAGTWTRVAEPLLSPTVGWEGTGVQEPDVHYESGTWKMWYSSATVSGGIGYASCTSDPTVPGNWTKYASNPVVGLGGSGISGFAARQHVHKVSGTYHMFYSDTVGGGNLKRTTSTDGLAWTAPTTAITTSSVAGTFGWANSDLWFDGTNWWLFVEASNHSGGGGPWGCYLFKNSSLTNDGGWVVQNGGAGLTTLQVSGYTNGYGQGLSIAEIDGTDTFQIGAPYVLWCHASMATTSDIMHAYGSAPSFTTWTPASPFDLLHNGSQYEQTQAADPNVLQVAGKSYLFFTGENAISLAGYINLATFNGTLQQFLNGSQGTGTVTNTTSTGGSLTVTNPGGPTVNLDVAPSGVTAGTYGSGSQTAAITVGADGRVTAAAATPITVTPLTNPATPDLIFTAAGDAIMAPS